MTEETDQQMDKDIAFVNGCADDLGLALLAVAEALNLPTANLEFSEIAARKRALLLTHGAVVMGIFQAIRSARQNSFDTSQRAEHLANDLFAAEQIILSRFGHEECSSEVLPSKYLPSANAHKEFYKDHSALLAELVRQLQVDG